MDNFKRFIKGFTTSLIDGEKTLMLPEEATATKDDLTSPAGALGWWLRCYLDGVVVGLALLGLIAKVRGYFNNEEE